MLTPLQLPKTPGPAHSRSCSKQNNKPRSKFEVTLNEIKETETQIHTQVQRLEIFDQWIRLHHFSLHSAFALLALPTWNPFQIMSETSPNQTLFPPLSNTCVQCRSAHVRHIWIYIYILCIYTHTHVFIFLIALMIRYAHMIKYIYINT